ncbi:MAG: sigma-70 family RNA polymerase sigma factor [Planctomycetes bacterium]|nr:sigma-70 family RNA polymerase sigma factor [Planctomycetota bacterium]
MTDPPIQPRQATGFPSTLWSELRSARERGADPSVSAEWLARYAAPIESYLRVALRRDAESAKDLAQDFFAWMLQTGFVDKADPARGSFRAFVKKSLRNYVLDADRARRAGKRGGSASHVVLGSTSPDKGEAIQVADPAARLPEEELDRAWKRELVAQALSHVRAAMEQEQKTVPFAIFCDFFFAQGEAPSYRELAQRHGVSQAEVSNALQRTKARYRAELKALVLETVASIEDLDGELSWLFAQEQP